MTRFILLVLVIFGTLGCVSSSKYEELEKRHKSKESEASKLKTDLEQANTKISEMSVLITELQNQLGNSARDKSQLQASIKEMQEAIADLKKRKRETEKRIKEFKDLTSRFREFIDAGQLSVKIINGRMVVALNSDVLFSSGSARLSKAGNESIQQVSSLLSSIPDKKFQIEGHTDNVPIRTKAFPSNWELASSRALRVMKKMIDSGMPPERISAASYGEFYPISDNETKEGRQMNRRIEIAIVPDLSTLPGFDELRKISEGKSPIEKLNEQ